MSDLLVFGLLFAAVAIGWVLGRRSATSPPPVSTYFSGQFSGQPRADDPPADGVIDHLADGLAVDGGSARTHIAMGVQLRRRGEVDGAVRIHEDLLARPALPVEEQTRARLELARDYISAGLLDRAEEILLELVREFPGQCQAARGHLLEIYEAERDWRRAIEVAKALLPRKLQWEKREQPPLSRSQGAALRLAHYCCELAEAARLSGDLAGARKLLAEALERDSKCVRASLLLGQVEYDCGHFRQAVQALRRVRQQDPDYLPDTFELLRLCYQALGDQRSMREYLVDSLALRPTPALVAAVAADMVEAEGSAAAGDFLAEQLLQYPSLAGLSQLIGLQLGTSEGKPRQDFELLQTLSRRLLASRPAYRCGHCGFAGKNLHWNCPGCKHWGSIKAIGGPGS
ncbi:MAG: lipopolysaccharide assembly protein LapB [Gammaproteobacteria bacterium]|nr:lipopolysaccharide assembly protein LapB [Gammaproteobacteria bacterium]